MPVIGETVQYNSSYSPNNSSLPISYRWELTPQNAGNILPSITSKDITVEWLIVGTATLKLEVDNCGNGVESTKNIVVTGVTSTTTTSTTTTQSTTTQSTTTQGTTTQGTTTTTTQGTTTTVLPNTLYYELGGCNPAFYAFTTIFGNAGDRAVDPNTGEFYTYSGGTVFQNTVPTHYNGSIQHTGAIGCPGDTTSNTTTTVAPTLSFDLRQICSEGTELFEISNIQNSIGGNEYSINNGNTWTPINSTPMTFDVSGFIGQTVVTIVRDASGTGTQRNLVVTDCVAVTTTTTTQATTTTTQAPNVLYYELGGCNPAFYAYTTIFGNAGDRAVDSNNGEFYTYSGGTVFQNTPPTHYNGSIQHTGMTGCVTESTTSTSTIPVLTFDATLICAGDTEYIQVSNIYNGSGSSFEQSINNGASWSGTGSNIDVSGFVNQTVVVIVRDVNNHGSGASRSVFVTNCEVVTTTTTTTTTTTQATTTTTQEPNTLYYELGGCNPAFYAYTTIYGAAGDRAVDPNTGEFYTYSGGTVFQNTVPTFYNGSIQHTGTTGCPSEETTTNSTTTISQSLSFSATLICSGGTEHIQLSNIINGSGSYEYSIDLGSNWTTTGSDIDVSGFVNQTVVVIVRDVNNTASSTSRSVFVSEC